MGKLSIKGFVDSAQNEKGIVLPITIMVMTILILMGGTALKMAGIEILLTGNYQGAVQALHAAESGVEMVYYAFEQGDTNGDGSVNGSDTANTTNDLDSNGVIDFQQAFIATTNIGSDTSRVEVNSGNTRAFIWVDASLAPSIVLIHSRGNPAQTSSKREVTLTIKTSAKNISHGALNNST